LQVITENNDSKEQIAEEMTMDNQGNSTVPDPTSAQSQRQRQFRLKQHKQLRDEQS